MIQSLIQLMVEMQLMVTFDHPKPIIRSPEYPKNAITDYLSQKEIKVNLEVLMNKTK